MVKLLAENPQGKHGKHVYSLEEFGLTAAGVRSTSGTTASASTSR